MCIHLYIATTRFNNNHSITESVFCLMEISNRSLTTVENELLFFTEVDSRILFAAKSLSDSNVFEQTIINFL